MNRREFLGAALAAACTTVSGKAEPSSAPEVPRIANLWVNGKPVGFVTSLLVSYTYLDRDSERYVTDVKAYLLDRDLTILVASFELSPTAAWRLGLTKPTQAAE